MTNTKKQRVPTEVDVTRSFETLRQLTLKATGVEGVRPLFRGFKIVDGIKQHTVNAVELFKAGDFVGAMKEIGNARNWLFNALRKYCANSVAADGFFDRIIDDLPPLDEELETPLRELHARFVELATVIGTTHKVDLDAASKLYWELLDGLQAAKIEQEARMEARAGELATQAETTRVEKIKAKNRRQDAEDEASRKRNKARDDKQREERENERRERLSKAAGSIADQFAALGFVPTPASESESASA